jgi:ABC-2 type transport system ATP-binding protein
MGIAASNLTKVYGTQTAVDDVSFEMSTGEVLGFLGPNGAGKTTTMRILTCYLDPTAGAATLDGYDIHDHPEEVRRPGPLCPQPGAGQHARRPGPPEHDRP